MELDKHQDVIKFHLPTELMQAASFSSDWCVFRYKLNSFISEQKRAVMHILILLSGHLGLAHRELNYPSLAYGKHPFTSFFPILD